MNLELGELVQYQLTFRDIIQNLGVSLLCGLIITLIYRITYKGLSYSSTFVNSIIMLSLTTTVIMMVIGNSLATAFGLVGAMSIIRFRTAVKDSQDILFIFLSLAMGMACGVGRFDIALYGSIFIGVVFYIVVQVNLTTPRKRDFLLQLVVEGEDSKSFDAAEILSKYCKKNQLVNVKALGEDSQNMMELSFYIKLKKETEGKNLVAEVKQLAGVRHVNLFFDEE
jgi:uncharacterized membrane protein YhiD involved in acid resistance